jgi:hypothetical protein
MSPIDHVIQSLSAAGYPISGDALATFSNAAELHFGKGGVLDHIDVHQTGELERLLEIRATVTKRAHTLQEVSAALRPAWAALAFSEFEASTCTWYQDGTVLRFATAAEQGGRGGMFATGEVIVSGGTYSSLVERFENEFGDMHAGLRPMPPRE